MSIDASSRSLAHAAGKLARLAWLRQRVGVASGFGRLGAIFLRYF
jgi:hypothetical protein